MRSRGAASGGMTLFPLTASKGFAISPTLLLRNRAWGGSRVGLDNTGAGLRPLLFPTFTAFGRRVEARECCKALLAGFGLRPRPPPEPSWGRSSTFYKLNFIYFRGFQRRMYQCIHVSIFMTYYFSVLFIFILAHSLTFVQY